MEETARGDRPSVVDIKERARTYRAGQKTMGGCGHGQTLHPATAQGCTSPAHALVLPAAWANDRERGDKALRQLSQETQLFSTLHFETRIIRIFLIGRRPFSHRGTIWGVLHTPLPH